MSYCTCRTLLFTGIILLLAACGPDQAETVFKRTSNEVNIRIENEPDRLNPCLTTSAYSRQVFSHIFQFLIDQDPNTLEFIPTLVERLPEVVEYQEGERKGMAALSYRMRDEAVWDDGTPITANDYIFTMKAMLNPKVPAQAYRPYLSFIESIDVDESDPKRFTVLLNSTYILGPEVAGALVPVLPEHVYDSAGYMRDIPFSTFTDSEAIAALAESDSRLDDFATQFTQPYFSREPGGLVGSGAYRLAAWNTGQRIELQRKQNWWADQLAEKNTSLIALPEALHFINVPDDASALSALRAEELDVASRLETTTFLELQSDSAAARLFNFFSPLAFESVFIYTNTRNPLLSDKRVRKAIAHAVNVEEIITEVQGGLAVASASPVHPSVPYHNDELKPIPFDIAQAQSLLEEAGWTDSNGDGTVDKQINGVQTELELELLLTPNRETGKNIALLMQNTARQAGIKITPVPRDFRVMITDIRAGNYQLAFGANALPSTLWEPKQRFHTQAGDNRTGFGNAQTDQLIDELRQTLDEEKRTAMYFELQKAIYEELPVIYLYVPKGRVVVHKRFEPVLRPTVPYFSPQLFALKEGI